MPFSRHNPQASAPRRMMPRKTHITSDIFHLMFNTRPVGGMASARSATATSWCGHCGMNLAAPSSRPGSSVRCAFCHRVTRVAERHRGVGEGAAGADALALAAAASPPRAAPAGLEVVPASYPDVSGRNKRALLVGVSYRGTAHELRGTVNDVKEMRCLLCGKFAFPGDCILELTEDERDPSRVPTRENLLLAMRWLVDGSGSGDSLVFHLDRADEEAGAAPASEARKTAMERWEAGGKEEAVHMLGFRWVGRRCSDGWKCGTYGGEAI